MVIPGGGFQELAMGLEGTEICDWLTVHHLKNAADLPASE
jgi:hypothetical protein